AQRCGKQASALSGVGEESTAHMDDERLACQCAQTQLKALSVFAGRPENTGHLHDIMVAVTGLPKCKDYITLGEAVTALHAHYLATPEVRANGTGVRASGAQATPAPGA
ncbi:MAG: hypothetical protein WAO98_09675, partial [Alphaproteobacteria bacterium]